MGALSQISSRRHLRSHAAHATSPPASVRCQRKHVITRRVTHPHHSRRSTIAIAHARNVNILRTSPSSSSLTNLLAEASFCARASSSSQSQHRNRERERAAERQSGRASVTESPSELRRARAPALARAPSHTRSRSLAPACARSDR